MSSPPRPWHSLRHYRTLAGLSFTQLAKRSGLARSYVGHLENGTKPPTATAVAALAMALQISPEQLAIAQAAPEVINQLQLEHAALGEKIDELRRIVTNQGAA